MSTMVTSDEVRATSVSLTLHAKLRQSVCAWMAGALRKYTSSGRLVSISFIHGQLNGGIWGLKWGRFTEKDLV
uniref:Uncharacterized protein n=1 Tax=Panagrellus redivivus TaxID=6233 RepID=A0A7E5A0I8_PANRE